MQSPQRKTLREKELTFIANVFTTLRKTLRSLLEICGVIRKKTFFKPI
jgi:hypothetical protein